MRNSGADGPTTNEEADKMKELWKDEDGLTTVEYALLLALVAVAALGAWSTLGGTVEDTARTASDRIVAGE